MYTERFQSNEKYVTLQNFLIMLALGFRLNISGSLSLTNDSFYIAWIFDPQKFQPVFSKIS